jgi:hypothetical protein
VAAVLLLVGCAWLDLALELPPAVRLTCLLAAGASGAGWSPGPPRPPPATARLVARPAARRGRRTGGQILAGVDLARQYGGSPGRRGGVTRRARKPRARVGRPGPDRPPRSRAARLAAGVQAAAAVPLKPPLLAGRPRRRRRTGAADWRRPPPGWRPPVGAVHPTRSATTRRTPDPVRGRAGATRCCTARRSTSGRRRPVGTSSSSTSSCCRPTPRPRCGPARPPPARRSRASRCLPMFPEPGGSWRATWAEVTTAGRYLVRTRGARSGKFGYDVVTVPEIKDVRYRVTPPAYTRKPPYEGPLPQGGLSGLPGTTIEAWVTSNRPLAGGTARFVPSTDAAPRRCRVTRLKVRRKPPRAGASPRHDPARADRPERRRGEADVQDRPAGQAGARRHRRGRAGVAGDGVGPGPPAAGRPAVRPGDGAAAAELRHARTSRSTCRCWPRTTTACPGCRCSAA